ncbi:DNA repair protein RecN [Flavobacterium silvaticum]|uniref:DNA repair protein RecN n=1 Tax=Flavobacterium silvaticum TaxID=1852020 RepID=A0A972FPR5_9FLAO|nr:DNA repair protein RecN [Flavobacterium silvaticum]NMH29125.1 DNA repair protein RecN [Flavobacterium silvaticum]
MITQLSISNFALIDKLSLELKPGFSIITGETGAGKSILLGALGLVLGKRADLSSMKDETEKCVIEAHFNIKKYGLNSFFESADLDYDDNTIIRREILPTGKSRAFINDSPVNLQQMQELGEKLVDIHSQHQTLSLSDDAYQFELLDAFAGNVILRQQFSGLLVSFRNKSKKLRDLQQQLAERQKEQGYHEFLLEELNAANLKEDEQQILEQTLSELSHAETIQENLERASALIDSDEFGLRNTLSEVKQSIQKIAGYSEQYQSFNDRIESVRIEISDIASELDRCSQRIVKDSAEMERVGNRLQVIMDLQKKHQVSTVSELIGIQQQLSEQTQSTEELLSVINRLENENQQLSIELENLAASLHQKRIGSSEELSQQLITILQQLGMPDARFFIDLKPSEQLNDFGKDSIELLFSANKGIGFQPLRKVASGGELSRIMLAVKATLARYSNLPTLIFDEIDTGVSGEIAHKMAEIMKEMSAHMQLISITHLPQIAAKGDYHYKVFKLVSDGQTSSQIRLLSADDRVNEIAQMLSGSELSDSAINHARALLN